MKLDLNKSSAIKQAPIKWLCLLLYLILFPSCHKSSFSPVMSAVANGKDWVANFTTYYRGNGEWNYDGFRNDSSRIEIHLHSVAEGTFAMDSLSGAFIFYFKGDKLYEPTQGAGTFTISSVKNGIVSGKFEIVAVNADDGDSVNITDGSFDGFPGE